MKRLLVFLLAFVFGGCTADKPGMFEPTAGVGVSSARAGTWYVDDDGGDNNGPGTSTNPWATIDRAVGLQTGYSYQVEPGDTIIVKDGHYKGGGIDIDWITLIAENPPVGEKWTAIIDESFDGVAHIKMEDTIGITIDGFHFSNIASVGARVHGASRFTIRRCFFDGSPGDTYATALQGGPCRVAVFEYNKCYQLGNSTAHAVYFSGGLDASPWESLDSVFVRYNTFEEHRPGQSAVFFNCNAAANDKPYYKPQVYGNYFINNHVNDIKALATDSLMIFNNSFTSDRIMTRYCFEAGEEGANSMASKGTKFYNNSMVLPNSIYIVNQRDSADQPFYFNNFVACPSTPYLDVQQGGSDGNVEVVTQSVATGESCYPRDDIMWTRLYRGAEYSGFLYANTAYRTLLENLGVEKWDNGAGLIIYAPLFDIDAVSRPKGVGWDVGCYEYPVAGGEGQPGGKFDIRVEP